MMRALPSTPRGGRASSQLTSAWRPLARRSLSGARRSTASSSAWSWSSSTAVTYRVNLWTMTTSSAFCPGRETAGGALKCRHNAPCACLPGSCCDFCTHPVLSEN